MLRFPNLAKARTHVSAVSFTGSAFTRGVSFTLSSFTRGASFKRVTALAIPLFAVIPLFGLAGCYRSECLTPEERMEESCLVQEVLRETSPRNMNAQPKAIPEFKTEPCEPVADEIYRDKPIPAEL